MTRRACIVDDDREVVALASKVASDAGLEATGFTDPFKAQAFLETERVDLVIVDLMMPEMDGYAMTEWVKEHNPFMRVINMTGVQELHRCADTVAIPRSRKLYKTSVSNRLSILSSGTRIAWCEPCGCSNRP